MVGNTCFLKNLLQQICFNVAEAEKEEENEFLVSEKKKNYTFLNKSCNLHAAIFSYYFLAFSEYMDTYIYTKFN